MTLAAKNQVDLPVIFANFKPKYPDLRVLRIFVNNVLLLKIP